MPSPALPAKRAHVSQFVPPAKKSQPATINRQENDHVVDTGPTLEDSVKLADWIEASGKVPSTIYITHGHLDHFLGGDVDADEGPGLGLS